MCIRDRLKRSIKLVSGCCEHIRLDSVSQCDVTSCFRRPGTTPGLTLESLTDTQDSKRRCHTLGQRQEHGSDLSSHTRNAPDASLVYVPSITF
eukprot:259749-Rhodomonas_salina.1